MSDLKSNHGAKMFKITSFVEATFLSSTQNSLNEYSSKLLEKIHCLLYFVLMAKLCIWRMVTCTFFCQITKYVQYFQLFVET